MSELGCSCVLSKKPLILAGSLFFVEGGGGGCALHQALFPYVVTAFVISAMRSFIDHPPSIHTQQLVKNYVSGNLLVH